MESKEKIIKAKIQLQKEQPFFSYISMHLEFIENSIMSRKTMGIDINGNVYYDNDFVKSLSMEQLKGVITHEILHLVLQHLERLKDKSRKIFNIACDLVVNDMILSDRNNGVNVDLPLYAIIPEIFNHSYTFKGSCFKNGAEKMIIKDINKKTAEDIYNILIKNKKFVSDYYFDNHIPPENDMLLNPLKKINCKNWNKISVEAYTYAKMQGKIPSNIERLVDNINKSKLNWKSILYRYITKELPFDYTYARPSKRSVATKIYTPSTIRESINIVVSVDTSGSIQQEELSQFLGEIIQISKSFNNVNIKLIVCDCEIKNVYDVKDANINKIMKLKICGGGGTSHVPVFDYIKKNIRGARILIALTDGYTEFPKKEEVRTIWVLSANSTTSKLPFGTEIRIK